MKFRLKDLFPLVKETLQQYGEDKISRLAAALAYYTVFSLAPMLVIAIAVTGFVWGEEAARGQLLDEITALVGEDAAGMVQTMIQNASDPGGGIIATVIGVATLLLGATGAFTQLQAALNQVWGVPEEKTGGGIKGMILDRLLSFGMVLGIAFLLLVSLVISAAVSALSELVVDLAPGMNFLLSAINFVLSLVLITGLFALLFKFVPDSKPRWRDVWVGAAVTSLLFVVGKTLIGIYLARSSTASTFGAAGSLVLILLWVYYSAQIVLIGAEFTAIFSQRYGSRQPVAETRMEGSMVSQRAAVSPTAPYTRDLQAPSAAALPAYRLGTSPEALGAAPRTQAGPISLATGVVLSVAVGIIGYVLNAARRDYIR